MHMNEDGESQVVARTFLSLRTQYAISISEFQSSLSPRKCLGLFIGFSQNTLFWRRIVFRSPICGWLWGNIAATNATQTSPKSHGPIFTVDHDEVTTAKFTREHFAPLCHGSLWWHKDNKNIYKVYCGLFSQWSKKTLEPQNPLKGMSCP